MRFRRTVYGDTADHELKPPDASTPATTADAGEHRSKKPGRPAHPIAVTHLAKIRSARLKEWHVALTSNGLSKASANRTLTALKAALNLAVRNRKVTAGVAQEWAEVTPMKGASRRRDLFLDVSQRRSLLASATGGLKDLVEAAMSTGCRAGELTSARRSAFDARTKSLTVTGKTGGRTIPLAPSAVDLFTRLSRDKLPNAFLLTRDDGKPWAHSDWDHLVKAAAANANLPAEVCLYTLRHSFITQALLDGMSTLEVAKIVGTSLAMIEKHYGHLVHATAHDRLAKVQIM
jgi:integrase